MQLELGQVISDTTADCNDTGIVAEVTYDYYGGNVYSIYWVCPREHGRSYTTTLHYTEEELDMEYSHCFEVIP